MSDSPPVRSSLGKVSCSGTPPTLDPQQSSNLPVTGQPIVPFGPHATRKESNGYIYFFPLSRQTKLDFGSPKPPPRGVLEEEASIDFVFIPPENKERVLTEHQKEVKRTKR